MRPYATHRVIELYGDIARAAGLPVSMVSLSDRPLDPLAYRVGALRSVIQPLVLPSIVRLESRAHVVILREFEARPFLLAAPFLWRSRRRMLLTCAHNIQRAHERRGDRLVLRSLHAVGFNMLVLESDAGVVELGIDPGSSRVLVLPLPLSADVGVPPRPARDGGPPIIGLIGNARAEKRFETVATRLEAALRDGELRARVLVGSPSAALRASATRRGFEAVDTKARDAYFRALGRCDVVAFDYEPEAYRFRTSGVVADAVAMGTAVVVPDLPVLRAQIETPVPVGAVYGTLQALPAAIREALRISQARPFPPLAYVEHRSPKRIAELMRAFLSRIPERPPDRFPRTR